MPEEQTQPVLGHPSALGCACHTCMCCPPDGRTLRTTNTWRAAPWRGCGEEEMLWHSCPAVQSLRQLFVWKQWQVAVTGLASWEADVREKTSDGGGMVLWSNRRFYSFSRDFFSASWLPSLSLASLFIAALWGTSWFPQWLTRTSEEWTKKMCLPLLVSITACAAPAAGKVTSSCFRPAHWRPTQKQHTVQQDTTAGNWTAVQEQLYRPPGWPNLVNPAPFAQVFLASF